MSRIAFVLAGLAYTGRSWQPALSVQQEESSPLSDPIAVLTALLLEFSPATAFSPSSSRPLGGVNCPGCKSTVGSLQPTVASVRSRLGHTVPVMKRKLKVKSYGSMLNLPKQKMNVTRVMGGKVVLKQGQTAKICEVQGLHITAGDFRNRRLVTPDIHLRPMMSRVREALFNILMPTGMFREGKSALDLYAGSGAVGLESLSRGMGSATFVDFSPRCVDTIHENVQKCGMEERANVVEASVEDFLREPTRYGVTQPFSLVTVTPPYEEVVYHDLMELVATSPCVADDTIVVVEYPLELGCFPPVIATSTGEVKKTLIGLRNRRYGRTVLAIYVNKPSDEMLYNLPAAQSEFMGV